MAESSLFSPAPCRIRMPRAAILLPRAPVNQVPSWWRMVVLGFVVFLLAIELSHLWQSPEYVGFDFHAYEAAALVGQQSGWSHIYDQGLVKAAESQLVPHQSTLRFISPPPVAWLAVPLTPLPFWLAYGVWAALMFSTLAFALAWSTSYQGLTRLVAVGVAIVPWWVLHAFYVGQVVPLVAASVLIAWRLLREDRDIAAGIVLSLVVLKPQTAAVAPLALLAAGRYRAFTAWVAAAAAVAGTSPLTLGPHGLAEYRASLNNLPANSYELTLAGAFGMTGATFAFAAALIVCAALVTARRVRSDPGMALAVGVLASLLATPYLFENDLCLLGAAGWILWQQRPTPFFRASLLAIWMFAATHLIVTGVSAPTLRQWPLIELALFIALVATAWSGLLDRRPASSPTRFSSEADQGTRASA